MQNFFLSCDWGTSSFRLNFVDAQNHQVIGEVSSDFGAAETYNCWKVLKPDSISKKDFYLDQLQHNIDDLSSKVFVSLDAMPVIISGMASSSIGIIELPYASLPFSIEGTDVIVHKLNATNNFLHDVYVISGVSNKLDVMRGEETQMIGLSKIDNRVYSSEGIICIFPGTHSKHIIVKNGRIVDFQTYMTGELFHAMTHHSILKSAVSGYNDKKKLSEIDIDAFCRGISQSENSNLLHTLFSVRINQLFGYINEASNFFYLSGLLIGTELRSFLNGRNSHIMLCCGSNIYNLYQLAIKQLGMFDKTSLIGPEIIDRAAVEGQINIFEKLNRNLLKLIK